MPPPTSIRGPVHVEGERLRHRAADPALGLTHRRRFRPGARALDPCEERGSVHVDHEEQADTGGGERHRYRKRRDSQRAALLPAQEERRGARRHTQPAPVWMTTWGPPGSARVPLAEPPSGLRRFLRPPGVHRGQQAQHDRCRCPDRQGPGRGAHHGAPHVGPAPTDGVSPP